MCPARWGGCVWLKKLKPCLQVFVGRLLYQFYFPGSIGNWKGFVDSRLPWCAEFVDTAVSNFDIFNWIKYFGINNYSGFFDKRSKKESIQKKVNMWLILMNIKPVVLEYFVSFGLNCPTEVSGLITWDWIIFITVLSIKTWVVFYGDTIVCVALIIERNTNIIVMS